jgi:hypothetical protein
MAIILLNFKLYAATGSTASARKIPLDHMIPLDRRPGASLQIKLKHEIINFQNDYMLKYDFASMEFRYYTCLFKDQDERLAETQA